MNDSEKTLQEERKLRLELEKTNEKLLDELQREQKKNEKLSQVSKDYITINTEKWAEIQTKLSKIDQEEHDKESLRLILDETTKRLDKKIVYICLLEKKIENLKEKESNYLSEEVEGFFMCYACERSYETKKELGLVIDRGKSKLFICATCEKKSYGNKAEIISGIQ